MDAIRNRSHQKRIYARIIKSQKKYFKGFDDHLNGRFSLFYYRNDVYLSEYYLNVWNGGEELGVYLRGPSIDGTEDDRFILGFSTMTPGGGITAGLLAEEKGIIYLLHDGRTYSADGRGNPYFDEPKIEVDGRLYFTIASVDSETLFPRIVEFHQNRLNHRLGALSNGEPKYSVGFDPGAKKGGIRSSAIFSANHSPITTALHEEFIRRGYREVGCAANPDLLVENNKHRILFEVKPFAKLHDVIVACGQLMVYQEAANADLRIIVTEPFDFSNVAYLSNFIKKANIRIIYYRLVGDSFVFDNIDDEISTDRDA